MEKDAGFDGVISLRELEELKAFVKIHERYGAWGVGEVTHLHLRRVHTGDLFVTEHGYQAWTRITPKEVR